MNEKLKGLHVEYLFRAVLCLETMEECYNFFRGPVYRSGAKKRCPQRLQVAKMLHEHKVYSEIVQAKPAPALPQFSRVNRSLSYGCDGYQVVFDRVKDE